MIKLYEENTNSKSIEYKGYTINKFITKYGNDSFTQYEIKQPLYDGGFLTFIKDNGVTPRSATLSDSLFDSIEEAKAAIDNKEIIVSGGYKPGHGYSIAKHSDRGDTWECDRCGKTFYKDRNVKSYSIEDDDYYHLCKNCFDKLNSRKGNLGEAFTLSQNTNFENEFGYMFDSDTTLYAVSDEKDDPKLFYQWDSDSDVGYDLFPIEELLPDISIFDSISSAETYAKYDVLPEIHDNKVYIIAIKSDESTSYVKTIYKDNKIIESHFGGYYYRYEVHCISPLGTATLLGGSKSLEGAERIGYNQAKQIFESPFETTQHKLDMLDSIYIYDVENDVDCTTSELEDWIDGMMSQLSSRG